MIVEGKGGQKRKKTLCKNGNPPTPEQFLRPLRISSFRTFFFFPGVVKHGLEGPRKEEKLSGHKKALAD
jgi:hypothetical protein